MKGHDRKRASGAEAPGPSPPPASASPRERAAATLARLELRAGIGDVGAVREDDVSRLRAAVERGDYRPDPTTVARSLLRELVLELFA